MPSPIAVLTAVGVTAIHFVASVGVFFVAYRDGMGAFSAGTLPMGVKVIFILWIALTLPAYWPIAMIAPRDTFQGHWGYLPYFANSLLWGCGIAFLIHRRQSKVKVGSA